MGKAFGKLVALKEVELRWKLISELCFENLKEEIEDREQAFSEEVEETWEEIRHRLINERFGAVGNVDK